MADIVDPQTRSRMMAGVRATNTRPEQITRQFLFSKGFRFRLHRKDLPGKPDIVLPRYRAVVFVHGCFWHCHECRLFKWPKTRPMFWRTKLLSNRLRDIRNTDKLLRDGWRVCMLMECALKGVKTPVRQTALEQLAVWILSDSRLMRIEGECNT